MRLASDPPRRVVDVVVLVLAVGAVVAMHGVSAHASAVPHTALGAVEVPSHHGGGDASHHDDHHQRDVACSDCHGAASACALIVGGALVAPPRPGRSLPLRSTAAAAPTIRAMSPDPPVPKLVVPH